MTQRIVADAPVSPDVTAEIERVRELRDVAGDNRATVDIGNVTSTDEARRFLNWGPQFVPPIRKPARPASQLGPLRELRRLADAMRALVLGDQLADEAAPFVVQMNDVLEELYDCDGNDSLKTIVALVQAQLGGADLTAAHVNLIADVARFLFSQTLIDVTAVGEVVRMVDEAKLDVFRGTLAGDTADSTKVDDSCQRK